MSHEKRLKHLNLTPLWKNRLYSNGFFTAKDVLQKTEPELIRLLGFDLYTVQNLRKSISKSCIRHLRPAADLWSARTTRYLPLSTGLQDLDHVLRGGLPRGTLSEVAGPAGCGKTQTCLTLSVTACLPVERGGLGGSVIYIDTESAFAATRLIEVAQHRFPEFYSRKEEVDELGRKVWLYSEPTCAQFKKRLAHLEEDIIAQGANLVVVDSMASLVRKEYDGGGSLTGIQRTNLLAEQAAILKRLAETLNIVVVVTNQITTTFQKHSFGDNDSMTSGSEHCDSVTSESVIIPALGNTWSHCVNTRLILQYGQAHYRQVMIAKSPVAPFTQFTFYINKAGIQLQEGGTCHYQGSDPGLQSIQIHRLQAVNELKQ